MDTLEKFPKYFRGILPFKEIQELRTPLDKKLKKYFKTLKGSVQEKALTELPFTEAVEHLYRFEDMLTRLTDGKIYRLRPDVEADTLKNILIKNRMKTSKYIVKMVKNKKGDTDSPIFQKWLSSWLDSFVVQGFDFEITWALDDFESLGHIKEIDEHRSCFNKSGAWKEAPLVMAAGLFSSVPTFMLKLSKDNGPAGRCLGFIFNDRIYLTNAYYAKNSIRNSIHLFGAALEQASREKLKFKKFSGTMDNFPFYLNGDTIVTETSKSVTIPSNYIVFKEHKSCVVCSKKMKIFSNARFFVSPVCSPCRSEKKFYLCGGCDVVFISKRKLSGCNDCKKMLCDLCAKKVEHSSCGFCRKNYCSTILHHYLSGQKKIYKICGLCLEKEVKKEVFRTNLISKCEIHNLLYKSKTQRYYRTKSPCPKCHKEAIDRLFADRGIKVRGK